jgi:two-component system response regulator GlrR
VTSAETVLVVEEDVALQRLLQETLGTRYRVLTASCWAQALEIRARADVDAVVVDVTSGRPARLGELCGDAGAMPLVLLAGSNRPRPASTHIADERAPLFALAARPVQIGELAGTLEEVMAERRVAREMEQAEPGADVDSGILAVSREMQQVMSVIARAALSDSPVLITGESGTGKELLARALHTRSPRAHEPFVAVNCSAIPETLLESELFGHRRGAFTDARDDQCGLFRTAHRGTIFLDEIGDMSPALQGKLLRVLQEKEVQPVGVPTPVPVDVRIISATHRDLHALVDGGRFRHDLLYRINVIDVWVPPLRERPDDLAPLVRFLLGKLGARLG